ncbi:MAG: protein translocase subunit SecD [Dehalococcoidia bacterium]|nr:protein translocase subunit SecD [Dehalococcoidia bacterium]
MRRRLFSLVGMALVLALSLTTVLNENINLPGIEGRFVREGLKLGLDLKGGTHLLLEADFTRLGPGETEDEAMIGVVDGIKRRVDAYGVAEPIIQRHGGNRVLVQLPGVKNINEAVSLVRQAAFLDFREQEMDDSGIPVLDEKGSIKWIPARADLDGQEVHLTGAYLKRNSYVGREGQLSEPQVHFEWEGDGSTLFEEITTRLVGKPLGIFLDGELVSAPFVRDVIRDRGIITGITGEEGRVLAIQLNSGALPVPMTVIQQQDVDALLGADSLQRSVRAAVLGLILLLAFMLVYYRFLGLVGNVALLYYGVLVLALFKLVPVTLTLAGIAGFIISLGMAVDANVLVFERLKEELRRGSTFGAAVEVGFSRAWQAIRDSNVTTLIVCAVLYWFGSRFGHTSIMGFALTLGIGILTSMFTAIVVTRGLLRLARFTPVVRRMSWFAV